MYCIAEESSQKVWSNDFVVGLIRVSVFSFRVQHSTVTLLFQIFIRIPALTRPLQSVLWWFLCLDHSKSCLFCTSLWPLQYIFCNHCVILMTLAPSSSFLDPILSLVHQLLMSYTTPFHTSCVGVKWKICTAYRASFRHILKKVTVCLSSSIWNIKCFLHLHFWNRIQSFL